MSERERLYHLVEELDEQQVPGVLRVLESLVHPDSRLVTEVDEDDGPLTDEERAMIRDAG